MVLVKLERVELDRLNIAFYAGRFQTVALELSRYVRGGFAMALASVFRPSSLSEARNSTYDHHRAPSGADAAISANGTARAKIQPVIFVLDIGLLASIHLPARAACGGINVILRSEMMFRRECELVNPPKSSLRYDSAALFSSKQLEDYGKTLTAIATS